MCIRDSYRDDPVAPLWTSSPRRLFDKRLDINSLIYLIHGMARRAGIKKRMYPYLFRHSGATDLAIENIHEAKMRKLCGWSPTSNMPARYVHLAGVDVENAVLEARGVKVEQKKRMMAPKFCPRCEEENGPELTYCSRCGTNLDTPIYTQSEIKELRRENKEMEKRLTILEKQGHT